MGKDRKPQDNIMLNEKYVKTILQTTGECFWLLDACTKKILDVNDAYCNMCGYARDEILQMRVWDIDAHDQPLQIAQRMERIIRGGTEKFETHHRRKNATIFTVEISISFLDIHDGLFVCFIRDITERKEAESELRETRDRMQFALHASGIGVWDFDLSQQVFAHADEIDKIFRCTHKHPRWDIDTFISHIHPDDKAMVKRRFDAAVVKKAHWDFECRILCKDGTQRWIRMYGRHKEGNGSSNSRIIGVVQDIDDRKTAETKMRENHELLTNLARLVPGVIYQYRLRPNGQSAFPYSSPGMYDIYELTPEQVREDAAPVFGRLHPEDAEMVSEKIFHSAQTLEEFFVEFRVVLPGKGVRWRWSRAHPERTEDGGTLWHGIITDSTDRVLAEQAVAAEKERLAVTLRSIGDGVITTDTRGHVVIMNRVAEKLTGWSQNQARGKPLSTVFNIVDAENRLRRKNPVQEIVHTGQVIELGENTLLISQDGTERLIADSAAPIKDHKSVIVGVVIVFRDVTEKKNLMHAAQRTSKLESLGILAGGIAHDFNNLLGGIFGYIDMAHEKVTEPQASGYLSKAMRSIDRARALTLQLLTFAKGGAPIKTTEKLFPFIEETVRFALSGSSVCPHFDISDNLWPSNFDRNQIGQLIDNIVINAKQAMHQEGMLYVSARNVEVQQKHLDLARGQYVKISLRDTGTGIPTNTLSRIFDPFFTTKSKGYGLGLATCYSIIRRHGGSIEVESEQGRGTTFHIYLPSASGEPFPAVEKTAGRHKGSGIFIVMDDEVIMRETIGDMLETFGYTVEFSENGRQAINCFEALHCSGHKIAGLIFDLTIPGGMGGKEAIGEIRKIDFRVPIFVASGYSEDPVMANPQRYGFTASICKPFMRHDLADLLNSHIQMDE